MEDAWTELTVREHLPDVVVKLGEILHAGALSGRGRPYATVSVATHYSPTLGRRVWQSWEYSWSAVVRSLNSGRPLSV